MFNIAPFIAANQAAQQALRRKRENEENLRRRQQLERESKRKQELERVSHSNECKDMKTFEIYEEGFCVMEGSAQAHYIGSAEGKDFLDACRNYITKNPGAGYIRKFSINGEECEYACNCGCRWFPTLAEAQRSFG